MNDQELPEYSEIVGRLTKVLQNIESDIDQIGRHPSPDKRPLALTKLAKVNSKFIVDGLMPALNSTGEVSYPAGRSLTAWAVDQYALVSVAPSMELSRTQLCPVFP